MKKETTTTRAAAGRRVRTETKQPPAGPRAFVDVHPNVIECWTPNAAGIAENLFRHVDTKWGTLGLSAIWPMFASGLESAGFSVTVRTFDARGAQIA